MKTKTCCSPYCKDKQKPISEFTKDKTRNDGLCPYCKECKSINQKEYNLKYPWKRVFNNINARSELGHWYGGYELYCQNFNLVIGY